MISKSFTITATPDMMTKIVRLLAWLHYNTRWGHSATIAIDCDGDGNDSVTVEGNYFADIEAQKQYVGRIREKTKDVEWIGAG